jgi:hypothetical protein
MTYVAPSNYKLIDRAARYAGLLLRRHHGRDVPYETIVRRFFQLKQDLRPDEAVVLRAVEALSAERDPAGFDSGGQGLQKFELQLRTLALQHPWGLSRGTAASKEYWYLRLRSGEWEGWGEAAHNARYGEDLQGIERHLRREAAEFVARPSAEWRAMLAGLPVTAGTRSARACLEMAALDVLAREAGMSLREYLGMPAIVPPPTSYSIGIDLISCCFVLHPNDGSFYIIYHSHQVRFRSEPVSNIHDHMSLRRKMSEKWTGTIIFIKNIKGTAMHKNESKTRRLYSFRWLPYIT